MLLVDEFEMHVQPRRTRRGCDALRRPVGVEHAESRAAGRLGGARGGEEREASRARDCNLPVHFFFLLRSSAALRPFKARARTTSVGPQPYAIEQRKSGGEGRGARRRRRIESGCEKRRFARLGSVRGGRSRGGEWTPRGSEGGAALGVERTQAAVPSLPALSAPFSRHAFPTLFLPRPPPTLQR